jgi:RHS repeat-associated protein
LEHGGVRKKAKGAKELYQVRLRHDRQFMYGWLSKKEAGKYDIPRHLSGQIALLLDSDTCYAGCMKEYKLVIARKYYAGVAMREAGTLYWLLTDHLGSTSKVANYDGLTVHSEQMYKPFGEKRYPAGASTLPTTYRYTGQRSETGLGPAGGEGLMFYNSRWFDPMLGRFAQPDTVIPNPGDPASFDRYSYVRNNPLRYIDPNGHDPTCTLLLDGQCVKWSDNRTIEPRASTCHYGTPIYINGKRCILVPIENKNLSTYNYADVKEANKQGTDYESHANDELTVKVYYPGGGYEEITAPWRFWYGVEGVLQAGTGIYYDGRPIYAGSWKGTWKNNSKNERDYFEGTASFYWGYGATGNPLRPYIDAAVGSDYKGMIFYIPILDGYKGMSGVVYGVDTGGDINDDTIEIFTGTGLVTKDSHIRAIDSTRVYIVVCSD